MAHRLRHDLDLPTTLINPFRNEADAFKVLVAFVVGAAAVIVVTLASEPVYGLAVAAVLLGAGIGKLWSDYRSTQRASGG